MPPAPKIAYQEQVALILDAAAACIGEASLLDFTMSAISRKAGISMGSIYKHMQSKEDVLVALGHESLLYFEEVTRQVLSLPLPESWPYNWLVTSTLHPMRSAPSSAHCWAMKLS